MLSIYCGVPGSGKSSMAAYLALKQFKRNKRHPKKALGVYSNTPIVGAYELKSVDIGKVHLEDGLILIDEAGIEFNNRSFMSFPKYTSDWFKLHRHYNTNVCVFSQSWEDMDKKIRDIAAKIYICSKVPILPIVITKEVKVKIGIDENTHKLTDENYFVPFLRGGVRFHWVRKAWKLFDSYDAPRLALYDFPVYGKRNKYD